MYDPVCMLLQYNSTNRHHFDFIIWIPELHDSLNIGYYLPSQPLIRASIMSVSLILNEQHMNKPNCHRQDQNTNLQPCYIFSQSSILSFLATSLHDAASKVLICIAKRLDLIVRLIVRHSPYHITNKLIMACFLN